MTLRLWWQRCADTRRVRTEVQETACAALYFLIKGNNKNKRLARSAGTRALAEAALKAHHATKKVVKEARDFLQ